MSKLADHITLAAVAMLFMFLGGILVSAQEIEQKKISLKIEDKVLHPVNPLLFGQFVERAGWAKERGVEAALVPGTRDLIPGVKELVEELSPTIMRFPGGKTVDYTDWTDLLDNAPGRSSGRPVTTSDGITLTHNFGIDEYFALETVTNAETILVVNLLDALAGRKPLEEAALHAAGLVAYVNSPVGEPLPAGMPDWPSIRAQNGHPAPHGVRFIQLGNEWFISEFKRAVESHLGTDDPLTHEAWYSQVLETYIRKIREVDPLIQFIMDGEAGEKIEEQLLARPFLRENVEYIAYHIYSPGAVGPMPLMSSPEAHGLVSPLRMQQLFSGSLGRRDNRGLNQGLPQTDRIEYARSLGYQIACTEWNYNYWTKKGFPPEYRGSLEDSAGLAAATFLNGMLRQGVALATQSFLTGEEWSISTIRIDTKGGSPPRFLPQGLATKLYRFQHGNEVLSSVIEGVSVQTIPGEFKIGWTDMKGSLANFDAVVTRDEKHIYIHAVNRLGNSSQRLSIDASALPGRMSNASATLHLLKSGNRGNLEAIPITLSDGMSWEIDWPASCAGILKISWAK